MPSSQDPHIAIVGASLTALTFTLSLLHHNPSLNPSKIVLYESRPPADQPGGQWYTRGATASESPTRPLLLTPNALKILEKLGIYDQIKNNGFAMSRTVYRDVDGKFLGSATFGGEKEFGYDALRIERMVLLPVLLRVIEDRGVKVEYHTSVRGVVSEDESGVTFEIRQAGRTTNVQADLLIGCDGIHSKVRSHVLGQPCNPIYHGLIMVPFKFDTTKIRYTSTFDPNELSLGVSTKKGTIMMIPADPSGTPSMSFRQFKYPEQTREGWEALDADKDRLAKMLTEDIEEWAAESDFVRSIFEQVKPQDTLVWPVYSLPKLDRWVSDGGKVIIIGDAAHSLIPAAAQGANVSIEDSWTLAKVLSESTHATETKTLQHWQSTRNERIVKAQKLSLQLMNARLPVEEQAKLPKDQVFDFESQSNDLKWLFEGVD
ncbi:hypothetical protein M409DRAFT_58985 [Zasmidium cellare ATCC 36951]|uniref:FAD-binding domain-containing protein n=1 Tax=Zasmidium cellare ATCC 36951 TaxID=1080233 RepID=A0A6A6C6T0_ZASCE|nr:uncharacterized protein M409DRAFT_58985 [Zasmidium cellare ATCC 36951]KAF2161592.1 hypothetical protein M409DRAFT_58985 [Zasmidium cellare ATCC 36951]